MTKILTKKQTEILKEVESICARMVQIHWEIWRNELDWGKKRKEFFEEGRRQGLKDGYWMNSIPGIDEFNEAILVLYRKIKKIHDEIEGQILKDLTLWELDSDGNIRPVSGLSVNTFGACGGYFLTPPFNPDVRYIDYSSNRDSFQKIKRAFIEEIRQNPQDWVIMDEINIPLDPRPNRFVGEEEIYRKDYHQVVKHKSGRKHNRGCWCWKEELGFTKKEWKEIKRVVKSERKKKQINFWENKENQNLTFRELVKGIKEKVVESLTKNNLRINDLNPGLWEGAENWEEKLEGIEDERQMVLFGQRMNEEIKAMAEKQSIQVPKPTPKNDNANLFLISIMVIGLSLILFSLVYKFRKRNK